MAATTYQSSQSSQFAPRLSQSQLSQMAIFPEPYSRNNPNYPPSLRSPLEMNVPGSAQAAEAAMNVPLLAASPGDYYFDTSCFSAQTPGSSSLYTYMNQVQKQPQLYSPSSSITLSPHQTYHPSFPQQQQQQQLQQQQPSSPSACGIGPQMQSAMSDGSVASTSSSAVGSPQTEPGQPLLMTSFANGPTNVTDAWVSPLPTIQLDSCQTQQQPTQQGDVEIYEDYSMPYPSNDNSFFDFINMDPASTPAPMDKIPLIDPTLFRPDFSRVIDKSPLNALSDHGPAMTTAASTSSRQFPVSYPAVLASQTPLDASQKQASLQYQQAYQVYQQQQQQQYQLAYPQQSQNQFPPQLHIQTFVGPASYPASPIVTSANQRHSVSAGARSGSLSPFLQPYSANYQPSGLEANPTASSSLFRRGSAPLMTSGYADAVASPSSPASTSASSSSSSRGASISAGNSHDSLPEAGRERQKCSICNKPFKDIKAHMLTHQHERPEKCPITACEYHTKGFARKYDKNRHTLTHYKGTMVCGFCPGSGSAAEKSFNRADVFKRHLTSVHGVEQTPPNKGKRNSSSGATNSSSPNSSSARSSNHGPSTLDGYPPDATGKCSTCSLTFPNAQEFYEHLDECVLRVVQQEDPTDSINAHHLTEVENDDTVRHTLERNKVPVPSNVLLTGGEQMNGHDSEDDEEFDEEMTEAEQQEYERQAKVMGVAGAGGVIRKSNLNAPFPSKKTAKGGVQKSKGMTHSRGGITLAVKRGRKHRGEYPSAWGFDDKSMNMRKRVLTLFDGPRRLTKDDMMLAKQHEIRLRLPSGDGYVTDLDVQTMKRAQGILSATEEEKGPWVSDDPTPEDREMMEMIARQQSLPQKHVL